ncbi:PadR family transcriptional regulator [Kibdelosporangium aridum]|uniref:Transcriptional regulator PadR-like family protein n=1 Tax=Kibdelosporangium aridum TaxID=2030 RepID=A0A1Y5Y509_KIBAR|nr:PadR family transcriptional regulator [Kibdelosporangium aridum]SMD25637.1 Transcriptional regulator PadR-like family protein [Kibdelosporangium aridum]
MNWALPEWTVLALLREQPRHGFAIAASTAVDGPVGRVWQIARPVIYRALDRLEAAQLIRPLTVESGPGPQRTIYELTPAGADAVDEWLTEPVRHVRDMRSHLLVKLALLDLRGIDPTPLLRRQQDVLEPIVAALAKERQEGFDGVLAAWRYTNASAALGFVTDLLPGPGA